jgi:putative chitinase
MIKVTLEQLKKLAPNIRANYQEAFAEADTVLATYGINKNKLRVAHFMAQALHETGGLTILIENMNYRAERIMQVWDKRFPTIESAKPYAHNPEKLANKVYGGRMGNVNPGDGWKFIGRGLIQLTGRESYKKFGDRLGVNLVANPDLAYSGKWALKIAAEEWKASGCNAFADEDSIRKVTKAINGGLIGLASREDWHVKAKQIWMP